jgi:hypothetical protein
MESVPPEGDDWKTRNYFEILGVPRDCTGECVAFIGVDVLAPLSYTIARTHARADADVKRAYYALSRSVALRCVTLLSYSRSMYHPDKATSAAERDIHTERQQKLNECYEVGPLAVALCVCVCVCVFVCVSLSVRLCVCYLLTYRRRAGAQGRRLARAVHPAAGRPGVRRGLHCSGDAHRQDPSNVRGSVA